MKKWNSKSFFSINLVLVIIIMSALLLFTNSQQDSIDHYLETTEVPIASIEGVLKSDKEPNAFVSKFVDDELIIEDISKTTHLLWHEEELLINNSRKLISRILYVNEVLWNNLSSQAWDMSFLLYNFPIDIDIDTIYLQSEGNNYNISEINFTNIFSLPNIFLDFYLIRTSDYPILIFPLENSTLNIQQNNNIPEVDPGWLYNVNYYLDEDFIFNAGRINKIEDKMEEIVDLVIDNLQPNFSFYDVRASRLIEELNKIDNNNYWYFDYTASLFIPVILLFEVLFFYVTKSKFEESYEEFELYYNRGLSHKQLLRKMFIWSGLWILFLIPVSLFLFRSFGIFSQSLLNQLIQIIVPWIVTHSLLVLYLIFNQSRIFIRNISQNLTKNRWEMISNELPLLNRPLKILFVLPLYYFIMGVYKLLFESGNIEDITILSKLSSYYVEFINSFILFVIIAFYLIFKKLQSKSRRNILRNFFFKVTDRKKIFILLVMISLILNFSEFTFLHLYKQDKRVQEEGNSNLLGDYMIRFNEIDDLKKFIDLDYSKIPNVIGYLPLLEFSSLISGDGFNFHSGILLLNQTLFSEFISDVGYNNTLLSKPGFIWTSDPLYSFLISKDSFKIDGNAINLDKLNLFQRSTSGIIEENFNFINIVMSYETWNNINEINSFDTTLKIILDLNGSDIVYMDQLKEEITNNMEISESDFSISKIEKDTSSEIVRFKWNSAILDKILDIYNIMNILLVIFIVILMESLIINNADFAKELKTIYMKYGSLKKIAFIHLKIHIVFFVATTLSLILGVIHGIYIRGHSDSLFKYKSLSLLDEFSLKIIISSVFEFILLQILVQFLFYILTLRKLKRSRN